METPTIYPREFINSLQNQYTEKIDILNDFLELYNKIIGEDTIRPLFSQVYKYDFFPKKKNFKKYANITKGDNAWIPIKPKSEIDKIKKTIKIILNKITEENSDVLIETLVCEINKSNNADVLDILAKEIIEKIIFDKSYQNIFIKLCQRIWSMNNWHKNLVTIISDEHGNLFWYKNTAKEDVQLSGPCKDETSLRNDTDKKVNFKYSLLNILQKHFQKKNTYIEKSRKNDVDEDLRYKYRRNIFGTLEFIGKLFKKKYLSEKIVHLCILDLLDFENKDPQEEDIEGFCSLWCIIDNGPLAPFKKEFIFQYFEYISKIVKNKKWNMRIEFMMEDLLKRYQLKYEKYMQDLMHENTEEKIEDFTEEKIEDLIMNFKNVLHLQNAVHHLEKYTQHKVFIVQTITYSALDDSKRMDLLIALIKNLRFITPHDINQCLIYIRDNFQEISSDIPNLENHLSSFVDKLRQKEDAPSQ